LRVTPGARRQGIIGRHGDAWKVHVTAPPERARANAAVLEVLSDALGLPQSRLELVSGGRSRDKVVLVDGLSEDDVESTLASTVGAGR
jgi:uncharacterized protein (TIGR00251 family)